VGNDGSRAASQRGMADRNMGSQGLGSGHGFPRRPHDVNEALVQQVRSLFKV
jgi:hypothetical protein